LVSIAPPRPSMATAPSGSGVVMMPAVTCKQQQQQLGQQLDTQLGQWR
jgi:hypothetical protein